MERDIVASMEASSPANRRDVFSFSSPTSLVVPPMPPHKFSTGPDGYEGVHIHANARLVTEWLE